MVKEGIIYDSCAKKEKKCFWRIELGWDKACLACHDLCGWQGGVVGGRGRSIEEEEGGG